MLIELSLFVQDLRFSQWWRFRSWSSGIWHHV